MNIKSLFGFGALKSKFAEKKKVITSKPESRDGADRNSIDSSLEGFHLDKFQGGEQGGHSSGQGQWQGNPVQQVLPGSPAPGAYGTALRNSHTISVTVMPRTRAATPSHGVARSLPLDALTQVGKSAAGEVFHLDVRSSR